MGGVLSVEIKRDKILKPYSDIKIIVHVHSLGF